MGGGAVKEVRQEGKTRDRWCSMKEGGMGKGGREGKVRSEAVSQWRGKKEKEVKK